MSENATGAEAGAAAGCGCGTGAGCGTGGKKGGSPKRGGGGRAALFWAVCIVAAAGTVGMLVLAMDIQNRKNEGKQRAFPVTTLSETTVDPKEWGKNYPKQYDGYIRTVDVERTKYGGSENIQKLDADPMLREIFAGYAFAIDFREERGHAFMLSDQRETDRVTQRPQPGACLNCHSSSLVAMRQEGIKAGAAGTLEESATSPHGYEQMHKGFDVINKMTYNDATKLVDHPVSCIDCLDPSTTALRVTKVGFLNGIAALARSNDPVAHMPSIGRWRAGARARDYDPNIDASRQEMRSMACGQCHVEYYFKGDAKTLTFPWAKGLKVDDIEAYYDEQGFKDWTHAKSGAPVLKAQHPEFEMWSQGIHARSGVSCADCHMPYKREGAVKVSDHHVRSPMLNVSRSCQTCHHYDEAEIKARVEVIQDRTVQLLYRAEMATVELIQAIEAAKLAGLTEADLQAARGLQRRAQFRTDF
ncbi:MAG: ammonia-forming cytochrome c nitrite reductase subunit c552, partial [Phycisphaerales bacterium]|nr:ammonia-forming cytochrome c nitrite reductase subunit c552 [Phycisphaerales bacterium]